MRYDPPSAAISTVDRGYLDPFLGSGRRARYDSAAERYSAAVVLFEMATGTTPVYGDGLSDPATVPDEATMHDGLFDPAIAPGLTAFFRTALARDAAQRHHTAADMLTAWTALFAPVPMSVPDDADARFEAAQASTPLGDAGLSARALSALEPVGVSTVGDLIALDPVRLNRLSGVAEPTRKEIKQRAKRWRDRFAAAVTGRSRQASAPSTVEVTAPGRAAQLLLEAVGPARAETRRKVAALLIGLEPGLDAFATQGELGVALALTRARAVQLVGQMQDAWAGAPAALDVLQRVGAIATEALADLGGVATVDELAGSFLAALPSDDVGGGAAGRLAAGLLRVSLDRLDALQRADADDAGLAKRRRQGRLLAVATAPGLLDLAEAFGRRADELVAEARAADEPVIGRGRAIAALREVAARAAESPVRLPDDRLLRLAAALSQTAAISGRGELHPPRSVTGRGAGAGPGRRGQRAGDRCAGDPRPGARPVPGPAAAARPPAAGRAAQRGEAPPALRRAAACLPRPGGHRRHHGAGVPRHHRGHPAGDAAVGLGWAA